MIASLIETPDNYELIRDRVASILSMETAGQQALAVAAGRPPDGWAFKVFTERSNPWEDYLNDEVVTTPIVNVWYDNSNFDKARSNSVERQGAEATINIDCYAVGYSQSTADGHVAGDEAAARRIQHVTTLVRKIIMAAEYTYLKYRGVVAGRWITSVSIFQPKPDANTAQAIIGARVTLMVQFNEFSPQVEAVALEELGVTIYRAENGEILTKADYIYGE